MAQETPHRKRNAERTANKNLRAAAATAHGTPPPRDKAGHPGLASGNGQEGAEVHCVVGPCQLKRQHEGPPGMST
eukprot:15443162-Alexandrium_andersonii.AAC.1